jgi:hypothetical protein
MLGARGGYRQKKRMSRTELMMFLRPALTGLMFAALVAIIVLANLYTIPIGVTATIGIVAGVGVIMGGILSI